MRIFLSLIFSFFSAAALAENSDLLSKFKSYRIGNSDVQTRTSYGLALMGGDDSPPESFRWMMDKAGGGDFLVIRFTDDPWMNDYLFKLGRVNSVETLVVQSQEAANDPQVVEKIMKAEAIFFPGGNQWNYYSHWKNTRLISALNARVQSGVPFGGTSAGLAVMGEALYSAQFAQNVVVRSEELIADPYSTKLTLGKDFLKFSALQNVVTDSHFKERDRMGRFLAFLARAKKDRFVEKPIGIAVDEKTALLYEPQKPWKVVGQGAAYRAYISDENFVCEPGQMLKLKAQIRKLTEKGSSDYNLFINYGKIDSDQRGGGIY